MTLKSKLVGLGICGSVLFGGWIGINGVREDMRKDYEKSRELITGEVVEEVYLESWSLLKSPERDGFVSYSGETVKLGDTKYILKIRTDSGNIIAVSVIDYGDGEKEALERIVETGSRVVFQRGNLFSGPYLAMTDEKQTYFYERTRVGTKRAGWIHVLDKTR